MALQSIFDGNSLVNSTGLSPLLPEKMAILDPWLG